MSINIKIGKEWVITSDPRQFILNQVSVRGQESKFAGEEYLIPVGYYQNIKSLVVGLLQRHARQSDVQTLSELQGLIESASATCQEAFEASKK